MSWPSDLTTAAAPLTAAEATAKIHPTMIPRKKSTRFARGNRAAAKGEPRTVTLSVRIPVRTAEQLAGIAYGRGSRADALIEIIDDAAAQRAE